MTRLRLATVCCVALTALIAWHASPTPWRLLLQARDITMWIDATRIDSTRADHAIGVWLRFDYPKPEPVPGNTGQFYSQTQVRLAVDCRAERARNLTMILMLQDGGQLRTNGLDSAAAPVAFAAHPFGHGTFVAVCGWLRGPDVYHPPVLDN